MMVRDLVFARLARSLLAGGGLLASLAVTTLVPKRVQPAEPPVLAIEVRDPATVVREVALEVEAPDEAEAQGAPGAPEPADPLATISPMDSIADPADFAFVVEVSGTRYIELASPGDVDVDPDRTKAELLDGSSFVAAVVPFSADALPESLRPWKGRRVLVGGTCAATVVGFAEVTRVSGDPRLALPDGDPADHPSWTLETVFSSGHTMIAGELAGDCTGAWARAADRPAIGRAIAVKDARLERAARRAFLASPHAGAIADAWREAKEPGDWRDHVTLAVRIVKHSITGARWAFVHARKPGGCGRHDVNVLATYQVSGAGALTEIETGDFDGNAIVDLIDLNGDGWFERLADGETDTTLSLVAPTDSSTLASISVPLRGCGC